MKITRRQFIKVGGSAAIGVAFASVAGGFVWNLFNNPDKLFYRKPHKAGSDAADTDFASPYKRTFAFSAEGEILAFEVYDKTIYLALADKLCAYDLTGKLINSVSLPGEVRDLAAYNGELYLLYASRIEVYSLSGEALRSWEACSDNSDYCSLTVFEGGVFVTDAANKNVCKYNLDGSLACFINSPIGFVVPSYCFGITNMNGMVYCSNPGKHKVETYTADGKFVDSFGESGTAEGKFCGCCNPVHITPANTGEILTSEKGIPRVSCYSTDGSFRSVLLNNKMLGGGHDAYEVRVCDDKLIVAGGKNIQVFQYDEMAAADTLCGSCTLDCPMKVARK